MEDNKQDNKELSMAEQAMLAIKKQVFKARKQQAINLYLIGQELEEERERENQEKLIRKIMRRKKIIVIVTVVILAFLLANPTNNDFKNYIQGNYGFDLNKHAVLYPYGRTNYFGLFSIYKYSQLDNYGAVLKTETYIGVFKNFIKVDEKNN